MPQVVTQDRPAGDVKIGDYVFSIKVVHVNRRIKKTTLTLETPIDGKDSWEFRLEDMLEVGREEPTPEEIEEKRQAMLSAKREEFIDRVKGFAPSVRDEWERSEEKRRKALANNYFLDTYEFGREMYLRVQLGLALEIEGFLNSARDGVLHLHPGEECDFQYSSENGQQQCVVTPVIPTEYDACRIIVERLVSRLTSLAMRTRVLSRSTSVLDNLFEDLKREVLAEFLDSLRFAAPIEEVPLPWK